MNHLILPDTDIELNSSMWANAGQQFCAPGPIFTEAHVTPQAKLSCTEEPDQPRSRQHRALACSARDRGTGQYLLLLSTPARLGARTAHLLKCVPRKPSSIPNPGGPVSTALLGNRVLADAANVKPQTGGPYQRREQWTQAHGEDIPTVTEARTAVLHPPARECWGRRGPRRLGEPPEGARPWPIGELRSHTPLSTRPEN